MIANLVPPRLSLMVFVMLATSTADVTRLYLDFRRVPNAITAMFHSRKWRAVTSETTSMWKSFRCDTRFFCV